MKTRTLGQLDTAELDGPFANEEHVGEAPAPVRDCVVLATTCGCNIDPVTGELNGNLNSHPDQINADHVAVRLL